MIVEANREYAGGHETIDVVVDPFNIICDLFSDWKASIGVACDSPIMGGYWMFYHDAEERYTRIRLATREEILTFESFKHMLEITGKMI